MPVPRKHAHSTARCPFHSKMPILQVRPKGARDCSRPWRRAPTLKIIPLLSNAFPRLPIPDSRFPIPDSRFPTPDSRFPIPHNCR
ncbi:MAG: hypothetical protein F6K37_23080 [Moorea sp. SIO4E2]|uniref:hypothetical protein n=1 Tax=Moorena sp. SIO4E2 TaxID=2607826 RepID=UPI0013BD21AE|nr:hypothetical protein [Moorena sp. SIO4E2]NEQ08727.1 hypothetical protein [Moorena sp. SIO4E2]